MNTDNLANLGRLLAIVAGFVFAGVALYEFSYASAHAQRYGPAMVIAWSGVGGTLLSGAVLAVASCIQPTQSNDSYRRRGR